jgi:Ser/Thr protein kinase RdoA (MazF antagonist)
MGVRDLLAGDLAAPFERATEADAVTLALRHWGVRAERATRVDTERDDTFHVETAAGGYALKIAHPADDPAVIDLQVATTEWAVAHDPSLPVPRFVPTLDGTLQPVVPIAGVGRIARLMPWVPAQSLRAAIWDAAPSSTLLHSIGSTQARLTVALADFRHPAESRALAWDVARLPELAELIDAVADPAPVATALDRHAREVAPRLATLPRQLIHNDGNLDNLLVDGLGVAGPQLGGLAPHSGSQGPSLTTGVHRVVAVLDFGDVVRTARVLDLAVTTSYLLPADDQYGASDTLAAMVAGWESVLPLEPGERELLPRLVIARLLQRILLGSWLAREVPDNADYLGRNIAHTTAQLAIAEQEGL